MIGQKDHKINQLAELVSLKEQELVDLRLKSEVQIQIPVVDDNQLK